MCVFTKDRRFYSFIINSKPKLKNSAYHFWNIYQERKTRTTFHGELKVLENFTAPFLLKTIIWTWVLQSVYFKNEGENVHIKSGNEQ